MYDTPLLEANFGLGMVRDLPRSLIPPGGCYDLQDYLPDQPGKLYKRGGASYASNDVSSHGIVQMVGIADAPFSGDPRLVMIGSTGSDRILYDITSGTAATGVTITNQPFENPPFYVDGGEYPGFVLVTDGAGASVPKKVTLSGGVIGVSTLQNLFIRLGSSDTATPPHAAYSCIHLGSIVLANNTTYPNRLWFLPSPLTDPFDQTVSLYDCAGPITGLASVGGVLLVFTRNSIQRILGDVPPGYGGSIKAVNTQLQPMGGPGCIDARSIVYSNGLCYFAHESGIYFTNGASVQPLTTKKNDTGISTLWRSYTSDLDPVLGAVVASGIYSNNWMLTTIRHPAGPDVQFICYLPTGSFARTSLNVSAVMNATREAPHAQLYGANANGTPAAMRALSYQSCFNPASGNKNDPDGSAVLPVLEPRMIGEGPGLKSYSDAHLTYDLRDAASDNPTMKVEVAKGIEAPSYSAVAESPLAKTTDATRKRFTVSKDSQAVNFKFTQQNASSKTEIYSIEAAQRPYWVADGQ